MSELNKFKDEIFRRSEKMKEERRKRTRRAVSICLPLCLLVVFATATVFAKSAFKEKTSDEEIRPTHINKFEYFRESASDEIITTWADGTHKTLTYWKTEKSDDSDVYLDEDWYEYTFDKTGTLKSIHLNFTKYGEVLPKVKKYDGNVPTDSEFEVLARDYGKRIFGDIVDGYELYRVRKTGQYIYPYEVLFRYVYGENGFVEGEWFSVDIMVDGTIIGCTSPVLDNFKDFDPASLEGLTQDEIFAYATDCVKKEYGDTVLYEPVEVSLDKENGEYRLCISGTITDNSLDYEERISTIFIYYDLP